MLIAWAVCGLLPVILLRQHAYQYYVTYSLVPLVIGLARFCVPRPAWDRRVRAVVLAGWVMWLGAATASAAVWVRRIDAEGLNHQPLTRGTSHLVRRGRTVQAVSDALKDAEKEGRRVVGLILEDLDVAAFGPPGARVRWAGRDLFVYDGRRVVCAEGRLQAVETTGEPEGRRVLPIDDAAGVLWLRREGTMVVRRHLDEAAADRCDRSSRTGSTPASGVR